MKTPTKMFCAALALLAGGGLALTSLFAQSQPKAPAQIAQMDDLRATLEVLRSDFNTSKIATINQAMKLTGPEAEKFWPIYRRYEKDLAAVGDRKLELIREFGSLHFSGRLDDAKAKDLAERWLKNTQDRLDLWKKYHKEISKAVSPMRAAQFLQIENQMALFVDLNIAAEMPAVGSKPSAKP
jgi:hypothetical protein